MAKEQTTTTKICSKCRNQKDLQIFTKNEITLKTCESCRHKGKEVREKYSYPHGKQKYQCRDCGGAGICEHKTFKSICKICKEVGILCEHET